MSFTQCVSARKHRLQAALMTRLGINAELTFAASSRLTTAYLYAFMPQIRHSVEHSQRHISHRTQIGTVSTYLLYCHHPLTCWRRHVQHAVAHSQRKHHVASTE